MDIPFVRLAFPVVVLYLFYWALFLNPVMDTAATGGLSTDATREIMEHTRQLLLEKKFEQALPETLRIHQAFPENHIYIDQLATIYGAMGRFAEEAAMWEKYLLYAPMPGEACPQVAIAYKKQNKDAEALNAYERCYTMEPNSDNILFYAEALERNGNRAKALTLYELGVKRSPHYADMIVGLARVEMFMDRIADARKRVLEVLKTSPDNVDALLVAGMVCTRTGEYAAAQQYLQHGLKLSPNYEDLRIALARVAHGKRNTSAQFYRESDTAP
jgi:tetratricopeptide (TPR) repeat protein